MSKETAKLIGRGLLVWCAIIGAEFAHGALRVLLIEPLIGDFRARQLSVFSGMLIIFSISWLFVGWIGARSDRQLIAVGVLWLALTFGFEVSLGRLMHLSWERIFSDYDLSRGGLMPLGLLFLTFAPLIAGKLKKIV